MTIRIAFAKMGAVVCSLKTGEGLGTVAKGDKNISLAVVSYIVAKDDNKKQSKTFLFCSVCLATRELNP